MTDNDLLARLDDAFEAPAKPRDWQALARDAAAALRACDIDLAAARTLIYDLAGPDWLTAAAGLALQDRARAWLGSVSPPASGDDE